MQVVKHIKLLPRRWYLVPGEKKHGLGKGMGSLLSGFDYDAQIDNVISTTLQTKDIPYSASELDIVEKDTGDKILSVPISVVTPNINQPRKSFDEETLKELAESIKNQGVIQPLIVEEYAPGKYSIIAGERRYKASLMAGLSEIPVIVRNLNEQNRIEVSLIENVQRENLNSIEEAFAYQYLIQKTGYTQEEVAQRVGKSRSAVANTMRLLSLPDNIKDDLISGLLTAGHARAILSLVNPSDQVLLRNKIVEQELSVREAESLAEEYNKGRKVIQKKKEIKKDQEISYVEEKFVTALGAKVEIKGTLNRGKLQIRFRSQKELERIYSFLSDGADLFEE